MKILQIGCGNMGMPILQNCLEYYTNITLVKNKKTNIANVRCVVNFAEIENETFDIIIIAIKPQNFDQIRDGINQISNKDTIIISIMAAITTDYIGAKITNTKNLIRIMPNLGIALKSGGINLVFDGVKTQRSKQFIENVFKNKNNININVNEQMLDAITPITGCGSAYFLLLADICSNIMQPLVQNDIEISSRDIVFSLMKNAVELCEGSSFEEAISKVASKKGVTEAAITNMKNDLRKVLTNGIFAADDKIKELQNNFCKN